MQHTDILLLVVPLSSALQKRLIDRAAFVARRKALDVLVYCPALSTAPAHSELSLRIDNHATEEGLALARDHANRAVEALRAQNVAARARVDARQSVLRGALDVIAEEQPALMMISVHDHAEWSDQSLTDAGLLETCPVPIWVENAAKADTAVLGAVELDPGNDEIAALDERVAEEARRTAKALGATSHVVHSLTRQAEVPRFIETAVPGDIIDKAHRDLENRHVKLAYDLAERHHIARENIHLERGKTPEALTQAARALKASVIVMGASKRNGLSRLLFQSTPHRLLDRLHADVLIVNRPEA